MSDVSLRSPSSFSPSSSEAILLQRNFFKNQVLLLLLGASLLVAIPATWRTLSCVLLPDPSAPAPPIIPVTAPSPLGGS